MSDVPAEFRTFQPPSSPNKLRSEPDDPASEKDANVYRKGVTVFSEAWPTVAEVAGEKARQLRERGWGGDALREEVAETVDAAVEATLEDGFRHRRAYVERRLAETRDELTDYAEASRMPEESEFRSYVRDLDPDERRKVLRDVARNGSSMSRRAVLRPWIPPRMAGLQDEAHRERLTREAHRAENPDALQTSEALEVGLEELDKTAEAFRKKANALVRAVVDG